MHSLERLNDYLMLSGSPIELSFDNSQEDYRARLVALRAHIKQRRRNGDEYITHPIRVADAFKDPTERAVAYLHDVVEDTEFTLDDLRNFGFSEEAVLAIDSVTRRDEESYLDFVLRSKENKIGRKVKMADIEDNLEGATKHTREKYLLALWILNLGDDKC